MAQPAEIVMVLETPAGVAFAGPVRVFRAWLAALPREGTLAEALGSGQLAALSEAEPDGHEPTSTP